MATLIKIAQAEVLYQVDEQSSSGYISITAKKLYNTLDHTGNKTLYFVYLVTPFITSSTQEIRVSLQWNWR